VFEENGAGIRTVYKTFDASKRNLIQNDIVQLIPVRIGDCVLNVVSRVVTVDDANTFDVGDGDQVDNYVDGDVAETLGYSLSSLAGAEVGAIPKVYAAADTIDLKTLGAAAVDTLKVQVIATILSLQPRG
jgi:hypothetical protein